MQTRFSGSVAKPGWIVENLPESKNIFRRIVLIVEKGRTECRWHPWTGFGMLWIWHWTIRPRHWWNGLRSSSGLCHSGCGMSLRQCGIVRRYRTDALGGGFNPPLLKKLRTRGSGVSHLPSCRSHRWGYFRHRCHAIFCASHAGRPLCLVWENPIWRVLR